MREMLFVGRGGEGVVLASQILADTFGRAGYWVQSFPEFTAERRGAPISAYLRWDEHEPIRRRYKMRGCDVLVSLSPSLPPADVLASVRPGGLLLLNRETRVAARAPFGIARVPASAIARREGILSSEGRPMGNVALLGACMRLLLPGALDVLEQAIAARMPAPAATANVLAARDGYAHCTRQHTQPGDVPFETAAPPVSSAVRPRFPMSSVDSRRNRTGAWSLDRPVLTDACTACTVCAVFCPEGAISMSGGSMSIDYLHCKGCGICEVVCPVRGALPMEVIAA